MTTIRPATESHVSLYFTRAEVGAGYLWLQYSIDPVPDQVRLQGPVRDVVCGVAADADDVVLDDCRSSYRLALDLSHVVGVLAVGPDVSRRDGTLHIRFAPLCATPDLDRAVCDVEVGIRAGTVTHVSGRMR